MLTNNEKWVKHVTSSTQREPNQTLLTCGICGRSANEVGFLMTGLAGGIICDQCVERFHELVVEERTARAQHIPGAAILGTIVTTFSTHAGSLGQPEPPDLPVVRDKEPDS